MGWRVGWVCVVESEMRWEMEGMRGWARWGLLDRGCSGIQLPWNGAMCRSRDDSYEDYWSFVGIYGRGRGREGWGGMGAVCV